MLNGKYKSIKYILEKVFRDTGIAEGVDIYDAIEWTAECLELIGAPQIYAAKIDEIEICEFKGALPCDLHLIMQVRYVESKVDSSGNTRESYAPMRYGTDTFHMDNNNVKGGKQIGDLTYILNNSYIFTNFEEGKIQMAYKAFATDEDGWPVIPDDIKFVKAVEYYIREKIDYKLFRSGKLPQDVYEQTLQDQLWYIGAAQNRGKMPSIDQMENIKNNWIRLIPKINQHEDFFKSMGQIEKRTISGDGGYSNTRDISGRDLFNDINDIII